MNEESQAAAVESDLELRSLLPTRTNTEWQVKYVGQFECVCFDS